MYEKLVCSSQNRDFDMSHLNIKVWGKVMTSYSVSVCVFVSVTEYFCAHLLTHIVVSMVTEIEK